MRSPAPAPRSLHRLRSTGLRVSPEGTGHAQAVLQSAHGESADARNGVGVRGIVGEGEGHERKDDVGSGLCCRGGCNDGGRSVCADACRVRRSRGPGLRGNNWGALL